MDKVSPEMRWVAEKGLSVPPRILLRGLALMATLVAAGFLLRAIDVESIVDVGWIDAEVRGRGLVGEALFLLVGMVFTAVGLPRQVIAFLGGYAFGFVLGTLLALLATVAGCATAFAYARLLGRELVLARFPRRVRQADDFLRENPFTMTLLIRLLPVGSNLLTNLVAGVSSVAMLPFLAGTALGHLPQTAVFTLVGSGINVETGLRTTLAAVLFLASALLGVFLYRRYRRGKSFDEGIDQSLAGSRPSSSGLDMGTPSRDRPV